MAVHWAETRRCLLYESVLEKELIPLAEQIHPGDVVVLHDPQAVGLAPNLWDLGAFVI